MGKGSGNVLCAVLMENACEMASRWGPARGSQAPWEVSSEVDGNLSLHVSISLPCNFFTM